MGRPKRGLLPRQCATLAAAAAAWPGLTLSGFVARAAVRDRGFSRVARAAVRDREAALQTLGLDLEEPSPDDVKRAFRKQTRRWHPDAEGGDAARFQEVREAYNFLTGRGGSAQSSDVPAGGGARVWQDGVAQNKPDGSLGGLGGLLPAVLAVLLVAGGYLVLGPQPEPRSSSSSVMMRRKARFLRGMEYVMMASVAERKGGEVQYLADDAPYGSRERAERLAKTLVRKLDEKRNGGQATVTSVTAIVSEADTTNLLRLIREIEEEEGLFERRFPYLIFSGRPVARFEREATRQELLVISAFDYQRPLQDPIDTLFSQQMAEQHPPDLLVMDLSEQVWADLKKEYDAGWTAA